jgi:WD40 repeat protein
MAWIEYIAANSDLQKVYHGGKTISNLLRRRSQHKPNIGHLQTEIENLEIWGNDLLHLVTKFSQRMKAAPSAIQRLIPPFCPPESIIRKQFCMRNRGLSVHGTSGRTWDECLTTISFEKGTKPLSTAAGISYFALGMNNGKIFIYDDTIFQEIHVFSHQEPVWMLKFGDTGKHLASCSHKSIRVWNLETWAEDHKFSLKSVPFVVSFVERDSILLVATKRNELLTFDLVMGGARDEPTNWTRDFEESGEGPPLHLKQPMLGDFSPHESLLAIIYRGEDILLWDTDQDRIHDIYEKDTGSRNNGSLKIADGSTTVRSLTFSSSPDKYLLAATYSDGDLIVYDTWSGDVQKILPQGNLMSLASSPDGRTLVGAGTYGDVILYDFDTLRCLYRLSIANNTMLSRYISFTADSQRIIDTRMTQCRVWQPTVLHREDADEENSDTVSISTGPKEVDYQVLESLAITTICCVKPPGAGLSIVFAGKEDGTAHVFDISGEPCSEQLFVQSAGFPIAELHFDDQSGLLTCRDRSNRVTCRQLMRFQGKRWRAGDPLLDSSMGITKITQVLGSGRNSRLLVSAEDKDALWSLKGQSESPLAQVEGHKSRRWIPHPNNPECLILAKRSVVELRSWTNLACIGTIPFPNTDAVFNSIHRIVSLNNSRYFATAAIDPLQGSKSDCRFHVWDFKDLHPGQQLLVPSLSLGPLSDSIEEVVGVYGERLVYIDIRYWVCSIDISEPLDVPVRHFFIPNDWLSIVRELVVDVAKGGEIIFVKQADLAVIKRGLEVTDTGVIFNPRRKTAAVLLTRRGLRPPTIGRPGPSALPGRAFQSQ